MAAWWWSIVSLVAVAGVEVWIADDALEPATAGALRFFAALSTFCPGMAVLGAKRPQDRAWQAIVLALWLVLALPAGQSMLLGIGAVELHSAWSWFLVILIAAGGINYLFTRFWLASLIFVSAQLILLAQFLSWLPAVVPGEQAPIVGLGLADAALVLAALGVWPARAAATPIDRVWIDFRDAFGVVWGLRIAERINASARMYGWNVVLSWHGLVQPDGTPAAALPPETDQAVRESLKTLLRRFVSPAWIAERLGGT